MKLNIGCGPDVHDGWVNIDPDPGWAELNPNATVVEPPGSVDFDEFLAGQRLGGDPSLEGAVAHHVLQMVSWPELVPWLAAVRDALDPGAWLRVSVPDFPGAYAAALEGDLGWFPIDDGFERSIDGKLCLYLTQGGASRSVFTGPWLCDLFRRAGFVGVNVSGPARTNGPAWLTQLDNRPGESIYVEGHRP